MDKILIDNNKVIKDRVIDNIDDLFSIEIQTIEDVDFTFFDIHDELEIGITLEGSIQRYYTDRDYEIGRGEVWLTNMWEPHGLRINIVPTEIVFFGIRSNALTQLKFLEGSGIDWLAPFFSPPQYRPRKFSQQLTRRVLGLAIRAKTIQSTPSVNREALTKLIIMELLILIQEEWEAPNIDTKNLYSSFLKINPALELIFNSNSLITLQEAAAECGINEKAFSRQFKRVMGSSFSKYALGYRIKSAAFDLLNSDLPIKDLVYRWGFTDESHFSKVFQKYFNISPGEYRRRGIV